MNTSSIQRTQPQIAPLERVVLLGFMCSGKSSVGESVARRLGWQFLDFDVEIERRENRTIRQMVEEEGEGYLRAAEAALTEEVAGEPRLVIAPGGGWITQPELLEELRRGTLSVWLHVSAVETARRLVEDSINRPFRDLDDPVEPIREMLVDREPLYRRADLMIPTDRRSIEDIAYEIESLVRTRGHGRP